ncbi:MAG: alkaline phosphatase family protein [Bacteroidota bacterium]
MIEPQLDFQAFLSKNFSRFLLAAFLFAFGHPTASAAPKKPKLVLAIIIDQMRADYLWRFRDLFSAGGFNLLMNNGAVCTNSQYPYSSTLTACGHSAILSGITPGANGIIGNEWYDNSLRRSYYAVEDSTVRGVGIDPNRPEGKMSPRNFNGTTLGDELKRVSPSSKMIGIAIKDRAAILPSGIHPDGAYWFDAATGFWVTSTYYKNALPDWVNAFNNKRLPDSYLGKEWGKLLADSSYLRSGIDNAPGEGNLLGESSPVFPHKVYNESELPNQGSAPAGKYDPILYTPYGNELTTQFAEAAIEGDSLGQRDATDILSVSFSSPDYCGHTFGPNSYEIEDIYVRLDRQLEGFFHVIDNRIGLENVIIVLTSDHGVCPLPEERNAKNAQRLSSGDYVATVKTIAGQRFDYNEGVDNFITAFSNNYFYIDTVKLNQKNIPRASFENVIVQIMMKDDHIAQCYTREQIEESLAKGSGDDSILSRIGKSFNSARSGYVAVVVTPYSFFGGGSTGTTHGTPYWYDRAVPLIFYGQSFPHTTFGGECSPLDIEPTLARILKAGAPDHCRGKVLEQILGE